MLIQATDIYEIDLTEECCKKGDKSIIGSDTLVIDGEMLLYAIISAGMPDVYLTYPERTRRSDEILFKISLFETYVKKIHIEANRYKLAFDFDKKPYLDSTEVGFINYWIGMILTTALGQVKYGYEYLVHLKKLDSFSKNIELKKRKYKRKGGGTVYKSPDLIAINVSDDKYGVFESKGYTSYDLDAMSKAYDQAKSIKKINKKKTKNRLAVMTVTGKSEIKMFEKDPKGGKIELEVDTSLLDFYHYTPIVQLVNELEPAENDKVMTAKLGNGENEITINIAKPLYTSLLPYLSISEQSDANKFLDENLERIAGCMKELRGNKKTKIVSVK